jgi:hypothetical protein
VATVENPQQSQARDAPVCVYPWRAAFSGNGVRKPCQMQKKRYAVNYLFECIRVSFVKLRADI